MSFKLAPGYGLGGSIQESVAPTLADVFDQQVKNDDRYWMHQALLQAMNVVGHSSPNPTVGCVFVKDGVQIASGATEGFGKRHGERVAIANATSSLDGSTCYVTLEPCSHHGKQPPCVDHLIDAKISRCVVGLLDPFPQVNGQGIAKLKAANIETKIGILEDELLFWHFPFIFQQILNRPLIVAKWAQTSDGFLADDQGKSQWISGELSRRHTHFLRQKYDAIMVGAGTVLRDFPQLNARDSYISVKRHPVKIIIDRSGDLLKLNPELQEKLGQTLLVGAPVIYCGPLDKKSFLFKNENVTVLAIKDIDRSFIKSISDSYQKIIGHSLQSIMVEGGAKLISAFLNAELIDAYHIFEHPSFLGGTVNRIVRKTNSAYIPMNEKRDLSLIAANILGDDILIDALDDKVAKAIFDHRKK